MDNRGVTPVVEKLITMGLVVLFVGGMTTSLFGTAVPTYRDAAGAELGERVLSTASQEVEAAVPPNGSAVRSRTAVSLPSTIRGSGYRIRVDGRWLVLDHPSDRIGDRARLSLPQSVTTVTGEWDSGAETVVTVRSEQGGLRVELAEGAR